MSSNTQQSWKSLLSFTDRFAVIDQIASSLRLDPTLQHSQTLKTAQEIETQCFNEADTEEDYTYAWKSKISPETKQIHLPTPSPPFSPPTPNGFTFSDAVGGTTLGKYTSCHHHTSGLFSTIYRATSHHTTHQLVALKLTNPATMIAPHDSKREARILTQLTGHPNIIQMLESFTLPPSSFVLVFPFYNYDLNILLHDNPGGKDLTLQARLSILRQTAEALAWCHERGVIHRDVKPSNILVSESGTSVLADFGIAWHASDPASEPADEKITDVGTTAYRPPEILFGWKSYGPELDMWAFGCVVAECFMAPQEEDIETFFNAGDLGSELRLVGSIFGKLGTPTTETWPEAKQFPDFGKILFHVFPTKSWEELLPGASIEVRDLVGRLLVYEGSKRLNAKDAVAHEIFRGVSG
ncbi:cell division protein kinase [Morchella conica CCBAS932]|uniref:cyclin-dependent kinase n=1 Tax=Morchella conica CCBAS932 TaxID=1392247 RepID=A0A3N4KRE1_9PEZI|nr:cell division protein kinase [Morchella conica CCBAS932]